MPTAPSRRWTKLTVAYHAVLAGRVALYAAAWAMGTLHVASSRFDEVHGVLQVTGLGACAVVGLTWLHRAWSRVPAPCRRAYDGRRIEPAEAIWKLFVPIYDIYWIFLANIGLCGAVERHLERAGARSRKAPSTLALVACLVQLVPIANLIVSPFLWALFMVQVDAAQAEAERLDPAPRDPDAPGLLKSLGLIAGALILSWGVLALVFVAIWQLLSPAAPTPAP